MASRRPAEFAVRHWTYLHYVAQVALVCIHVIILALAAGSWPFLIVGYAGILWAVVRASREAVERVREFRTMREEGLFPMPWDEPEDGPPF